MLVNHVQYVMRLEHRAAHLHAEHASLALAPCIALLSHSIVALNSALRLLRSSNSDRHAFFGVFSELVPMVHEIVFFSLSSLSATIRLKTGLAAVDESSVQKKPTR